VLPKITAVARTAVMRPSLPDTGCLLRPFIHS
jgi:hypothetical protein